jgi:16S rRNA (cytosine967-C5)-methyltransferase
MTNPVSTNKDKKPNFNRERSAPRKPGRTPDKAHDLKPRRAAVEMAMAVLERGLLLDEAFEEACTALALEEGRDRGFARLMGTLMIRRLGQIDEAISRYLSKDLPPKAQRIRYVLRVGAAQILFVGTPVHAAVDTSVALVARDRSPGNRALKGLVNAILRRIGENAQEILAAQDEVELNIPAWLRAAWAGRFGAEAAREIGAASLLEAPLDISLKPGLDKAEWAEKLGAEVMPSGSLRLKSAGRIDALPGFSEGLWWVQDMAASLPANLLGAGEGSRVLDLCAAPGGKTAQLAAAGTQVMAVDQSKERLERLKENLQRLNLAAVVVASDAGLFKVKKPYPFILLDAPCTTTGTLRRHPDVMHHKKPKDVQAMALIQTRLLAHAASLLAPGGTLVYCVCSLQAEEGPAQIEALLQNNPKLTRLPIEAAEVGGLATFVLPTGDVQTLPSMGGGMDGFFISRLKLAGHA